MKKSKKNQLNISIIEPIGAYGGMEIYDLSVLDGLSKYINEVHLYTSTYFSRLDGLPIDKIKFVFGEIYSKEKNLFLRSLMVIVGLLRLAKALFINRYDIKYCHVFTYSLLELLIVIISRIGGGEVFVNIHDPKPFLNKSNILLKKLFYRQLRKKNCKVVTHSQYSRKILMAIFPKIYVDVMPHTDIDYIYTQGQRSGSESKELLKLCSEKKYILFFGQIKRNKGLDILIKAFYQSKIWSRGYNLLIVGRCWGEEWGGYQKMIDENSLSKYVVIVNDFIEPENVYHYFNSSEFVVLPYTEIFSSGVLIRALGYGKPVICSDLPAFLEEVVDGDNGIVFEAGNVGSLACILYSATLTSYIADSMSCKVIEKYSKKYDRYSVAKKMLEVFDS